MNNKIGLSLELMGVLMTEKSDPSQDDVNQYLKANNIEADAKLAKNTASEVNICLPYYSWIGENTASSISDDEMSDTSGGVFRLPPTTNEILYDRRNYYQEQWNFKMFWHGRIDLMNHDYSGDFDHAKNKRKYAEGYFAK